MIMAFTLEYSPRKRRRDRLVNLERYVVFLLWFLGLSSILSFFFLYAPNPFSALASFPYLIKNQSKQGNGECDLFSGHWIPDLRGSGYKNSSCSTIPESKNCFKHGRRDTDFVNWRWKPHGCDISRFAPKVFFRIVQGKTLAFIGDSVARNQMESLLCLLSQEETPKDMYKDKEDRVRTWYFPTHNFTLKVLWTKFFVVGKERVINGSNSGIFDLNLEKVEKAWTEKLPGLDYAVLSNGHWFFRPIYLRENNSVIACVYCSEEEQNVPSLGPKYALKRVFRSALKYINGCKECNGLFTIVRTFSPAHFENGSWNTGGRCNRTFPRSENEIKLENDWELRNVQVGEVERAKKKVKKNSGKRFEALDVTKAMLMRPDGHPDVNWNNQYMKGWSDCVHWCLPGPIDAWNDMLMALLIRKEGLSLHN